MIATPNGTAKPTKPAKPKPGEVTGAQNLTGRVGISILPNDLMFGALPGGTFATYRLMRCNPNVALARAVAFAPMKAAPWSYDADDDVDDDRVKLIQSEMDRLKDTLLADAFRSLDYGFQSFEKVWKVREDGRLGFEKIKPLDPDWVWPLVDPATGTLIGLRSGREDLDLTKMLWVTHDAECGDPFGRSRMENIRRCAWKPWVDMARRLDLYSSKGAGIIPMIHYPVGTSNGPDGSTKDNSEIAAILLGALGKTAGVTIPNQLEKWAEDLVMRAQAGASLKDLLSWRIEFLEAAAGHGTEMLESLKHFESLIFRGWLVPERSAIEGTFGTKAEAGEHGDLGETISAGTLGDIVRQINEQVVDDLLMANYGPDARGTVRIKPGPLRDEDQQFFRDAFKAVFTNPANVDLFERWIDVDAGLDIAGLPKRKEVIDGLDKGAPVDTGTALPDGPAGDAALAARVAGNPMPTQPAQRGAPVPSGGPVVQDTALNGAQVTALQGMLQAVADGQVPLETVRAAIQAAFPTLTDQQIQAMVGPLANFKPATPDAPQPGPANPADPKNPVPASASMSFSLFKLSTTQFDLGRGIAETIRAAAMKIPDSELAQDGRETEPHLTVKYGLHTSNANEVRGVLADQEPVQVILGKVSVFPAAGDHLFDVVKVEADSPQLQALNQKIAAALPHTDSYPAYQPHITLAYVKPGEGAKYAGADLGLDGLVLTLNQLTFSNPDGEKTLIALNPKPPAGGN